MVKNSFLVFIFLLAAFGIQAQQSSFLKVIRLGPGVNSEAEETFPLLSADGNQLFFSRILHPGNTGGKFSGADIWSSEKQGDEWLEATNDFQKWNNNFNNFIIGKNGSEDIFFLNNGKSPDKGILESRKIGPIWTKPKNIKLKGLPLQGYQGAFVSDENSVMIISAELPDTYGKEDLYVLTRDSTGSWSKPVNLGSTINTPESEISPFLSKDGQTLFFASNGHPGFGDFDIFYSRKKYDAWTLWEKVENMGERINTDAFEGYYSQFNESSAFFSSNRGGNLADIFQVVFLKDLEIRFRNNLLAVYEEPNEKDDRIYFRQSDYTTSFGVEKLPSVAIHSTHSISENKILAELIWFMHNRLKNDNTLRLSIVLESQSNLDWQLRTEKAIAIINYITTELTELGVDSKQVYFAKIKISNEKNMVVHFKAFKVK